MCGGCRIYCCCGVSVYEKISHHCDGRFLCSWLYLNLRWIECNLRRVQATSSASFLGILGRNFVWQPRRPIYIRADDSVASTGGGNFYKYALGTFEGLFYEYTPVTSCKIQFTPFHLLLGMAGFVKCLTRSCNQRKILPITLLPDNYEMRVN